MARLAGGDHGGRRAAGSLRVGPLGVEPQPQRDADRLRAGAEQCDRAVDAAAHRDRDPLAVRRGAEDATERRRQRVDDQRVASDRRRLEQRQPSEPPLEPVRVGLDDPVPLHRKPHASPLAVARRVAYDLDHGGTVALAPPRPRPGRHWTLPLPRLCGTWQARWVPCR
jgi:hypothetical protein